jgi:hypothetical protein
MTDFSQSKLIKSDFLKFKICPSYFWLYKHDPEKIDVDIDEAAKERLLQGQNIELIARTLFPEGKLVTTFKEDAKKDTLTLMQGGEKIIFQATAISPDNLLAMADILVFNSDTNKWDMYEVKSSNKLKDKHYVDITFQKIAFERDGISIGKLSVIHLDENYERRGDIEPNKLFKFTDVSELVENRIAQVEQDIPEAFSIILDENEPTSCPCRFSSTTKHCPAFKYFNPDIPTVSIYNLPDIGKSKKINKIEYLVSNNIIHLNDIPDDFKLSERERAIVELVKNNKPIIKTELIRDCLSKLEYPLYFLDYETISLALPPFDTCKPNYHTPFQYSLHIRYQPAGELQHFDFIAEDNLTNPIPRLMTKLKSEIGDVGSIIVWSGFEADKNVKAAIAYPEFKDFIENVNSRIFDLEQVFKKRMYVHPSFPGRSTIKLIQPILAPQLSYKSLEIQNGSLALWAWYKAVFKTEDKVEQRHIFDALLDYCSVDTEVMVDILDHLLEKISIDD